MRTLLRLAWPVILGYLAMMTMGLVDLLFVGRVSAEAVGAVGIGTSIFSWVMMLGLGILWGLDPLVSQAYGAGDLEGCRRYYHQALWVSITATIPLAAILFAVSYQLESFGIEPGVAAMAGQYLRILAPSLLPLFLFAAARQYLQSMSLVQVGFWILAVANLVNAAACWVLVPGRFGIPAMGAAGAGWATLISRTFTAVAVLVHLKRGQGRGDARYDLAAIPFRFEKDRMAQLIRMGLPSALQMLFEVGVFALATLLAGRFRAADLAAHQIVLNVASMTFMVPLGISSAGSILVGQAVGRGEPQEARIWGRRSLASGLGFMACTALLFLVFPRMVLGAYTSDAQIIEAAQGLLLVAALFQLSDGAQAVATGLLRGLGETRSSAIVHFVGHWFVGLPLGTWLAFRAGWGLKGLWTGLAVGLTTVALGLTARWFSRMAKAGAA